MPDISPRSSPYHAETIKESETEVNGWNLPSIVSQPKSDSSKPNSGGHSPCRLPLLDIQTSNIGQRAMVAKTQEVFKLPPISEEFKHSRKRRRCGPKLLGRLHRNMQCPCCNVADELIENRPMQDETRPSDCSSTLEQTSSESLLRLSELWTYCQDMNSMAYLGKPEPSTGTKPDRRGPLRSNIGTSNEKIPATNTRRGQILPSIDTRKASSADSSPMDGIQSSKTDTPVKKARPIKLQFTKR